MRMTSFQRDMIRDFTNSCEFSHRWEIEEMQDHCLNEISKVGMPPHFKAYYTQLFKVLKYKLKKFKGGAQ